MKLELIPVVRYWDYGQRDALELLERLRSAGVKHIGAFVPWSHLETDRQHSLQRFARQVLAGGFSLRLGVTPELGIGYSNAGVPDELLRERQNLAQDRLGRPIYACAPPNIHPLVSLLAPQVFQRYGHFLLKLVQELTEVFDEGLPQPVELVVTDSMFKHYRNAGLNSQDHGDFSLRHMQFGAGYKREEWTPALAEKIFFSRAHDFLESRFSRFSGLTVRSERIFAREANQQRLIEEMLSAGPSPAGLFRALTKGRASCSLAWLDDFHGLKDRERSFLISSALLTFGELWISENDFFQLSPSFQKKLGRMEQSFGQEAVELSQPAIALVQNRFAPARIPTLLQEKLGAGVLFRRSLSDITENEKAKLRLLAVEEGYSLELRQTLDLFSLAKKYDCTIVLFRSSLCESSRREIQKLKTFRLNHGWLFEIALFPEGGNILLVEGQESSTLSMDTLGDSLLSVARIEPLCALATKGGMAATLALDWRMSTNGDSSSEVAKMRTLILINPEPKAQQVELDFHAKAKIQGLQLGGGPAQSAEELPGTKFETELPGLSVIPLTVFLQPEIDSLPLAESYDSKEVEYESGMIASEEAHGTQAELA
jgi:hypothetical protein